MRTRPSLHRLANWIAVAGSAFILVSWLGSVVLSLSYNVNQGAAVHLTNGTIIFAGCFDGPPANAKDLQRALKDEKMRASGWRNYEGLHIRVTAAKWTTDWPARLGFVLPTRRTAHYTPTISFQLVTLPLWLPFSLATISAALLWRRDRPATEGHCPNCNYNMTGNESGTCPECGTAIRKVPHLIAENSG